MSSFVQITENDEIPCSMEDVAAADLDNAETLPSRLNPQPLKVRSINIHKVTGGAHSVKINAKNTSTTFRERNASMLFNECMADVWFALKLENETTNGDITESERIPAHSYMLATGSSVFLAMFSSTFPKLETIVIKDVESCAFKALLKFLYTDEVCINSDNVLPILYAAKKYLVSDLVRLCVNFLDNSLNAQNVCMILVQSRLFEENDLTKRCWDVIDALTQTVFDASSFLEIDHSTLNLIIDRDTLSCDEIALFKASLRWSESQCLTSQLNPSDPTNKRAVLREVFDKIRFTEMKLEEFANIIVPSGLLTSKEIADIFLFHFASEKPHLPFPTKSRTKLTMKRCRRFLSRACRTNQWRYRGRCDSIQFCTDRRIFVTGCGFYGSSSGSAEYMVCLEMKKDGCSVASVSTTILTDGSSSIFPVYFHQPVQIEPDTFYTVNAVLDGLALSYFGQSGLHEVQSESVTFQFQCSTESTNGTGVQGGQIPEIFFY